MILIEKCKASPKFLERWIKELIDDDKMKKLKERNIKDIKFKVQVRWPGKFVWCLNVIYNTISHFIFIILFRYIELFERMIRYFKQRSDILS